MDLIVEHRAGSKVGHADALSHHVDVTYGGTLSRDVLRAQAKDEFCDKQTPVN